ncbi:type II toxin-antitoxin system Phd/YefM family antitoxin [Candidatus Tisiphia endosymbiont of Metellina segmentata]|uniref:type II toxin-antitoxin system Phd/YefM family antitoxin n=1 Tax=Candidatus Tisiphia endosymbiont of Metellina segmentata TaxID=3066274 RepID=UPI00313E844F
MKKWQLQEARKHLAKIVDDVLQGEVQAIVKDNGEVIYLVPGQKYNKNDECSKFK